LIAPGTKLRDPENNLRTPENDLIAPGKAVKLALR
jgi:hypothetical protein